MNILTETPTAAPAYATLQEWAEIHKNLNGQGLKVVRALHELVKRKKYPNIRYYSSKPFRDKKANELTGTIIKFLSLLGFQAERISSSGRMIRVNGRMKYIPPTSRNGTADISATIRGRSVKIEVKIGRDRQSDAQRSYQEEVQRAGGVYIIAKDFQSFYAWVIEFIKHESR